MKEKNIVFIEKLSTDFNFNVEQRIILWKNEYDKLDGYEKVIDIGDILLKTSDDTKDNSLELELCDRVLSLIDSNTIAIIDTAYAGYSIFEGYKELYNQLKKHLKRINNTDVKFFLCQPLKFMGRRKLNDVLKEYVKLEKILGLRVYLFIDNENLTPDKLNEHEQEFLKYVLVIISKN